MEKYSKSQDFTDRQIAELIAKRHGKCITIAELLEALSLPVTDNHRRKVKGAVSRAVLELGLPIASSKKPPYGYTWCHDAISRAEGAQELVVQAVCMLKRARVLVKPSEIRRLLGQEGFPFEDAA